MQGSKSKHTITGSSTACAIGLGLAVCISILSSILGAVFISNEYLQIKSIIWWAIGTQFISAMLAAMCVGKLSKENNVLYSGITAGAYLLVLVFISILFFGGISVNTLYGTLSVICGGITGTLFSFNRKRTYSKRKKRMRNR